MGELPHIPVLSHEGATLNFEALERKLGELEVRNEERIGGIGPNQIRAEAVTEPKIAKEAVATEKIKNEAVTEAKLAKVLQERVTQDSGWKSVSFENSWKNTGGEFFAASYRKQGNVVRLRGTIEGGLSGKACFTLPAGFRPTGSTFSAAGQGAGSPANLTITSAGVVTPTATAISTIGLDGTTFTID